MSSCFCGRWFCDKKHLHNNDIGLGQASIASGVSFIGKPGDVNYVKQFNNAVNLPPPSPYKAVWISRVAKGETTDSYQAWLKEYLKDKSLSVTMTGQEWEDLLTSSHQWDSMASRRRAEAIEKVRNSLYK